MTGLASRSQLRWAFVRVAVIMVPLIELLGALSGRVAGSGADNIWLEALAKPGIYPPAEAFGIVWPILYALIGLAVAIVWHARGAKGRRAALWLFLIQLLLNLAWAPLFFRYQQIAAGFWLILAILAASLLTTLRFARIRRMAGWLMVPYLIWLMFAAVLNLRIWQLNPGGGPSVLDGGVVEMQLPPVQQE